MKILCLQKYGPQMATHRYRFAQYVPYFEKHKIEYEVQSLISDEEIKLKLRTGRYAILPLLKAYLARIFLCFRLHKFDLIVVYVEALPYLPYWVEWLLFYSRKPYIYDLDDPIYLNYKMSSSWLLRKLFKNKISSVFMRARINCMGSPDLVAEARLHSNAVELIPTVVNLKSYNQKKKHSQDHMPVTIGWMGSPSTSVEIPPLMKLFKEFTVTDRARVVLVGSAPIQNSIPGLEQRDWQFVRQNLDLLEFDIGIMPLEDTVWNRGKCGFKLLQYMAMGVPVIASDVGANKSIVSHGVDGFLVRSEDDWRQAITKMLTSAELRAEMGKAARSKIESQFCVEVYGDRYCEIIKNAIAKG